MYTYLTVYTFNTNYMYIKYIYIYTFQVAKLFEDFVNFEHRYA